MSGPNDYYGGSYPWDPRAVNRVRHQENRDFEPRFEEGIGDLVVRTTNLCLRKEIEPHFGTSTVLAQCSMFNHATSSNIVTVVQV